MNDYGNVNFTNKLPVEFQEETSEFDNLIKIKDSLDKKLKELELKLKIKNNVFDEIDEARKAKHLRVSVYFSLKRYGT